MRLALTVVSPGTHRTADIVLEAGPATPVGQIAAGLGCSMGADWHRARVLGFPAPRSSGPLAMASPVPDEILAVPLYVAGRLIPPRLTLLESPVRDGSVLSLGSPDGCIAPEPGGLVELRVVSGPGAAA
jgi:DNA segregation ATPase FtsK/SpoIIIE, S-DNA-T family